MKTGDVLHFALIVHLNILGWFRFKNKST